MIASLEPFAAAAGVVAPANVVVPVAELRGAIVLGVDVVIVVLAAGLGGVNGAVAGAASVLVLFEIAVSFD